MVRTFQLYNSTRKSPCPKLDESSNQQLYRKKIQTSKNFGKCLRLLQPYNSTGKKSRLENFGLSLQLFGSQGCHCCFEKLETLQLYEFKIQPNKFLIWNHLRKFDLIVVPLKTLHIYLNFELM